MVTQRGQRTKQTTGMAWDTTCEHTVHGAKVMDRGSHTGGGSIAATNLACKLFKLQSFVMGYFDRMMTLYGCERVTKKHSRNVDPTRILRVADAVIKRNKSFFEHPDFSEKAPAALSNGFVKDLDPKWFEYAQESTQKIVNEASRSSFSNLSTKKPGQNIWPKGIPKDFS